MRSAYDLDTPRDETRWRWDAACSPDTADLFWFVDTGRPDALKITAAHHEALAICKTCPVQPQCLDWEFAHPIPFARVVGGRVFTAKGKVFRP